MAAIDLDRPSIGALFADAADRWGPRIALRRRREPLQWSVLTWTEIGQQVRAMAAGLVSLGVKRGDRVALLASTRIEWSLLDYAILGVGAATVPIYHSSTGAQASHVLADSGARVLVVEDRAQLEKVHDLLDDAPDLDRIVVIDVMDLRGEPRGILLDELIREGRRLLRDDDGTLKAAWDAVGPEDLATIVYTSGTTGHPKGVRLSHHNLLAATRALHGMLDVDQDDTTVQCLPLSHIYARLAQYAALTHGYCIAYAQRVDSLKDVLVEVRPTFFYGVPRLYERIYHSVLSSYRDLPPLLQGVVRDGVNSKRERRGLPVSEERAKSRLPLARKLADRVKGRVAERTVFEPVRDALGGRVRFCVSGGAPLNVDVARFFRVCGIELLEGYGLTETCGAATVNPLGENRLGTVGRPLPGVRIRIASDGEVLIQGEAVFEGYHNQPDETAMAIDEEGWLHTGDVGRFDEAGHLVITDRKKDLIITSGAKNVAPQRVEAAMRTSPYVGDAMVFGDRKPYLVALLALDQEEVERFGRSLDLPDDDWSALLRDPRVRKLIDEEVGRCNAKLARFERVKRFRILPRALSVEGGELTPTLKVRRQAVAARYQPWIDGMYAELPPA